VHPAQGWLGRTADTELQAAQPWRPVLALPLPQRALEMPHSTPQCCTRSRRAGGHQEGVEQAQHQERCLAPPETPCSPGNFLAVPEIASCTPKPCSSGKGVVGSSGGCQPPRGKETKYAPPPAPQRGQQLPLAPRGCRAAIFPSSQSSSQQSWRCRDRGRGFLEWGPC